jgi:hypothetical protein
MPRLSLALFLAAAALAGTAAVSNAAAPAKESCSDLTAERAYLVQQAKRLTAEVELKNVQLGEASNAMGAAKAAPRKAELERRAEGYRRELSELLDRELEATNRLGYLDSTLAKQCKKGGGK